MLRTGIPMGQRNVALTRLTGHLIRRWLDVDLVAELIHLVNEERCCPRLPEDEVERILDSVASAEARRLGVLNGWAR
jgi:hypothetical protein